MTDHSRLEFLVNTYEDTLYRAALAILGDVCEAEDAVQDAFLRCWEKAPEFDSPEHAKAWLLRVLVNGCKSRLRSPWRRRTDSLDEAEEAAAFDRPAQTELFRQVMALPPKYRAAVYLYYYEGYSVKETGDLLGAKASTVQTWLMRARGQLKNKLKEAEA